MWVMWQFVGSLCSKWTVFGALGNAPRSRVPLPHQIGPPQGRCLVGEPISYELWCLACS